MKKLFALILVIILLLPGCGTPAPKYYIEGKDWQIVTVQSAQDGAVLAVGESLHESYPEAEVIGLTCKAEGGRLTFTMADQSWSASYALQKSDDNAAIYTVTIEDETGPAARFRHHLSGRSSRTNAGAAAGRVFAVFHRRGLNSPP